MEQRSSTVIGQVVAALFSDIESHGLETIETIDTNGEKLLKISAGDIATKVNMNPQAVGQILKTLGLRTRPTKLSGNLRRCIVLDEAVLNTLRKRYIPQDETVSSVSMVSTPGGLRQIDAVDTLEVSGKGERI